MENYSNLKPIRLFSKQVILPGCIDYPTDTSINNDVCYIFTHMLIFFLQDKNINKKENLIVNQNNYFPKYVPNNGKPGEVSLGGSWYEQAYITMVKNTSNNLLLPITFAIDTTTISSTAHMSVYAVMFTTT